MTSKVQLDSACKSVEGAFGIPNIEEVLNAEGIFVSSSAGTSMYPMLRNRRDTIVIRPAHHPLKPLDVALYHSGGRYVLHRVLTVHPDHYEIRGDNCVTTERVPRESVFGVLEQFYRGERLVSTSARSYKAYARTIVALSPVIRTYHRTRAFAAKILRRHR